jgi:hypothetical protein
VPDRADDVRAGRSPLNDRSPHVAGSGGKVLRVAYCSESQFGESSNGAPAPESDGCDTHVRELVAGRHGLNGFTRP